MRCWCCTGTEAPRVRSVPQGMFLSPLPMGAGVSPGLGLRGRVEDLLGAVLRVLAGGDLFLLAPDCLGKVSLRETVTTCFRALCVWETVTCRALWPPLASQP